MRAVPGKGRLPGRPGPRLPCTRGLAQPPLRPSPTEAEALACRTIAERGVQLIGTAHGQVLGNLMKNPTLR